MLGKEREKEEPVSFSLSPESLGFLRVLRRKDSQERYHYCHYCQSGQSHTFHLHFNQAKDAWLEWSGRKITFSFSRENYVESWSWLLKDEPLMSLAKIEAVFIFKPPLFSHWGRLLIKQESGESFNWSIGEIDHYIVSFRPENHEALPKDKRPLFTSPAVQKKVFEKQLLNFSFLNQEPSSL